MYGAYLWVSGICLRCVCDYHRNGRWCLLVFNEAPLSQAALGTVWLSVCLFQADISGKEMDCLLCAGTGWKRSNPSLGVLSVLGILCFFAGISLLR